MIRRLPFVWRYKYRLKNDDEVYVKIVFAFTQKGADNKFYNFVLDTHLHSEIINVELQ